MSGRGACAKTARWPHRAARRVPVNRALVAATSFTVCARACLRVCVGGLCPWLGVCVVVSGRTGVLGARRGRGGADGDAATRGARDCGGRRGSPRCDWPCQRPEHDPRPPEPSSCPHHDSASRLGRARSRSLCAVEGDGARVDSESPSPTNGNLSASNSIASPYL